LGPCRIEFEVVVPRDDELELCMDGFDVFNCAFEAWEAADLCEVAAVEEDVGFGGGGIVGVWPLSVGVGEDEEFVCHCCCCCCGGVVRERAMYVCMYFVEV
jgi:hypothetical protein